MKIGDVVYLDWDHEGAYYMVKIDAITESGITGHWIFMPDSVNTLIPSIEKYSFVWARILKIVPATKSWPDGPVTIKLNKDYTAIVDPKKDETIVGCQGFPNERILHLADEIKKMRSKALTR